MIGPGGLVPQVVLAVVDVRGVAGRGQGVGAVQGQQLVDPGLGEDPLELRLAQPLGLAEILMILDQPGDPLALGVGELQAPADSFGDPRADLLVVVEG